jgi:hypothetical protein
VAEAEVAGPGGAARARVRRAQSRQTLRARLRWPPAPSRAAVRPAARCAAPAAAAAPPFAPPGPQARREASCKAHTQTRQLRRLITQPLQRAMRHAPTLRGVCARRLGSLRLLCHRRAARRSTLQYGIRLRLPLRHLLRRVHREGRRPLRRRRRRGCGLRRRALLLRARGRVAERRARATAALRRRRSRRLRRCSAARRAVVRRRSRRAVFRGRLRANPGGNGSKRIDSRRKDCCKAAATRLAAHARAQQTRRAGHARHARRSRPRALL